MDITPTTEPYDRTSSNKTPATKILTINSPKNQHDKIPYDKTYTTTPRHKTSTKNPLRQTPYNKAPYDKTPKTNALRRNPNNKNHTINSYVNPTQQTLYDKNPLRKSPRTTKPLRQLPPP